MTRLLRSPSATFTVRDLFALIDGATFRGEAEFQSAVITGFNANLYSFPPHYGYRDAITWARRQGWLRVEGSEVTVCLDASDSAAPPLALVA